MTELNDVGIIYVFAGLFVLSVLSVLFYFYSVIPFMEERAYLLDAMHGARHPKEYRYWRRQLRRLYLRAIPVIGRFWR